MTARLPVLRGSMPAASLKELLGGAAHTAPGELFVAGPDERVRCTACAHRCSIGEGSAGACGVRWNRNGALRVPHGYVARRYARAVETNTVFHVLPGTKSLTFGMYGCDLRCPYCHNHRLSQALRDGATDERPVPITPEALVEEALLAGCRVMCAAYNEPFISAEWVREVFLAAKQRGLFTALISDAHSTPEALRYMRDATDVLRVDLKAHSEQAYRVLGGRLQPVLDSIALARQLGYWVEVVTLVVPGLNQERRALRGLGNQLREISLNLPWHLNGFVPRYRMEATQAASAPFLMEAAGAAYVAGSRFVYVGNAAACRELAHTRCPRCHEVLIRRHDYETLSVDLPGGACRRCSEPIPGLWDGAVTPPGRAGAGGP